jgi:peroxiredoxin
MALLHSEKLPIGWEANDFSLKDTDEKLRSLTDFTGKKGMLIIFTCNHCPYAQAAWPLTIELYEKFSQEIEFLAINPNDPERYPEDSFEQMKVKKMEWKIPFPYLFDSTQEVAKEYKAQCTPDPFLFKNEDGKPKLFYHGRINDNWQHTEQVREKNLEEAIKSLISGENPPDNPPASMGCSIKWKE